MIKQTRLIDEKTGEIQNTKMQYISTAFNEEKGYLFWARKSFAKSFQDVKYPKGMKYDEIGKMAVLAKHIWANTNMLGYRGNGGIKPYDIKGIGKLIELGPRQSYRFINSMIDLGMIARVKTDIEGREETQFYINPIYFFSSNRIPLNLYLIFRKQLDEVLPGWVKAEYAKSSS